MHITIQLCGTCIKYSKVIFEFHENVYFSTMRAMKMHTVLDNKEVKNTGLKKLNILLQIEVKHS